MLELLVLLGLFGVSPALNVNQAVNSGGLTVESWTLPVQGGTGVLQSPVTHLQGTQSQDEVMYQLQDANYQVQ
jgi:hypothetical protein